MISIPAPIPVQLPTAPSPPAQPSDGAASAPPGGFGQVLRLVKAGSGPTPSQDDKRPQPPSADPAAAVSLLALLPLLALQQPQANQAPAPAPQAADPGQLAPDPSSRLPPGLAATGMALPGGSLPPALTLLAPGGSLPPAPATLPPGSSLPPAAVTALPGGSLPPAPATQPDARAAGSQEDFLSAMARATIPVPAAGPAPTSSTVATAPNFQQPAPAPAAAAEQPQDSGQAGRKPVAAAQPAALATTGGAATPPAHTPRTPDSPATQPGTQVPASTASLQSAAATAPIGKAQASSKLTVVRTTVADGPAGVAGNNAPAPGPTLSSSATSGAARPPAPVTAGTTGADLLQQVKDLHQQALAQMPRTVEVVLRPEELGRVALRLSMTPDGNLQAHLQVTQAAVKTALESGLSDLHRQLQSQGLHLSGFHISVSGSSAGPAGDGSTAGQQPNERFQGRRGQPVPAQQPAGDTPAAPAGQPAVNPLVGRLLDHLA